MVAPTWWRFRVAVATQSFCISRPCQNALYQLRRPQWACRRPCTQRIWRTIFFYAAMNFSFVHLLGFNKRSRWYHSNNAEPSIKKSSWNSWNDIVIQAMTLDYKTCSKQAPVKFQRSIRPIDGVFAANSLIFSMGGVPNETQMPYIVQKYTMHWLQ